MKESIIYELKSLYRESMKIWAYHFGHEQAKSVCIIGSTRGNEAQQMFICSQLVKRLARIEKSGRIKEGKGITIIPCLNPYSLNIGKRFWPTDNTDINRMFPGYSLGETTQRVAAGVFDKIKDYEYGIQFASFYIPGKFLPHVKIMRTDYIDVEDAKKFSLPYVVLRNPRPYDTTTLNYNWQIWNTKAFSLYATVTDRVDEGNAKTMVESVLGFLSRTGIVDCECKLNYTSEIVDDSDFISLHCSSGGVLLYRKDGGSNIKMGQLIAEITDPYTGDVVEKITSPVEGKLYYTCQDPLVYQGAIVCQIIPTM